MVILVKILLAILTVGILAISIPAQAEWRETWDQPADSMIIRHNQATDTQQIYAIKSDTKDIYKYKGSPSQWERIGDPAYMFTSTGASLAKLIYLPPAESEIWVYSGQGELWNKIGHGSWDAIYGAWGKVYARDRFGDSLWENYDVDAWRKIGDGTSNARDFPMEYAAASDEAGNVMLYSIDLVGNVYYIYKYRGSGTNWDDIGFPSSKKPIEMAAGGKWIWVLDSENNLWECNTESQTPSWVEVHHFTSKPQLAVDIVNTGAGKPHVWFLTKDPNTATYILKYDGKNWTEYTDLPTGSSGGTLVIKSIYAGGGNLFGISYLEQKIYRYYPPTEEVEVTETDGHRGSLIPVPPEPPQRILPPTPNR